MPKMGTLLISTYFHFPLIPIQVLKYKLMQLVSFLYINNNDYFMSYLFDIALKNEVWKRNIAL